MNCIYKKCVWLWAPGSSYFHGSNRKLTRLLASHPQPQLLLSLSCVLPLSPGLRTGERSLMDLHHASGCHPSVWTERLLAGYPVMCSTHYFQSSDSSASGARGCSNAPKHPTLLPQSMRACSIYKEPLEKGPGHLSGMTFWKCRTNIILDPSISWQLASLFMALWWVCWEKEK